jgi:ketosteroid isomerase-like protein
MIPRLATVLVVAAAAAGARAAHADDAADIRAFIEAYDRAFVAKDLGRLAAFYHPDVTIFEGGGVNHGWADYRDHHLGPELAEFDGLEFVHRTVRPILPEAGGPVAYVTSEYHLKARINGREVEATGLETLILVRELAGPWRIRHSHTSSRRKQPPSQ